MAGKRKNYSAEFTAKVALEAIRGEAMIAELVAKHGVYQTLIRSWKRQVLEGMTAIFSGKAEAKAAGKEGEIESEPCRATGSSGHATSGQPVHKPAVHQGVAGCGGENLDGRARALDGQCDDRTAMAVAEV